MYKRKSRVCVVCGAREIWGETVYKREGKEEIEKAAHLPGSGTKIHNGLFHFSTPVVFNTSHAHPVNRRQKRTTVGASCRNDHFQSDCERMIGLFTRIELSNHRDTRQLVSITQHSQIYIA